ncbi:hypothetical protein PLESTB_000956600 [Pleodorina starrii]|uniref:CL1 n=1 Tax=Pleodorina starrii TaxID=330485 RepID=A0A9W6C2N9_9CHLO|nr:hypothetical protein PLESTM_001142000 [Pleodorina starrii]GLC77813.1 hypothetical protein PLESTB_000956600 [Pleodorina starrii]
MLGWTACLNRRNALTAYLFKCSHTFDQICNAERCLSGASASTSTFPPGPLHAPNLPLRYSAAATTAASLTYFFGKIASSGRPVFCAGPAFRSFSAAAVPAAAPATAADRAGTVGSSSSSNRFQAPWPWVDPSRAQVLPVSVGKKQKQPVPLTEALARILGALSPAERSRQSLEVFVRFRVDPRRSDHLVRGSVVLPYGTGKDIKLVVFAKGADADIARSEGVELIGDEELISAIVSTDGAAIAFDRLIATPDFMKPLARAGKVLGPKGLMPNPKMGTLTTDVAGAIRDIRRGRLDYRLSREAVIRAVLGGGSMSVEQLAANVGALVSSLWENRPKAVAAGPANGSAADGGAVSMVAAGAGHSGGGGAHHGATAIEGLERYFMTFILKTNHSPSVYISYESLIEAAAKNSHHSFRGGAAARKGA